jgi:hypothetical protein
MMRLLFVIPGDSDSSRWEHVACVLSDRDFPILRPFLATLSESIRRPIGFRSFARLRGIHLAVLRDLVERARSLPSTGAKSARAIERVLSLAELASSSGREVVVVGSRYRLNPIFSN